MSTNTLKTLRLLTREKLLRKLTAMQARVYLALLAHADFRTGECYPSVKRLAALTAHESSRSQVKAAIRALQAMGMIEVLALPPRGRSRYRLVVPAGEVESAPQVGLDQPHCDVGLNPPHGSGVASPHGGVKLTSHHNGVEVASQTPLNTSKEHTTSNTTPAARADDDDGGGVLVYTPLSIRERDADREELRRFLLGVVKFNPGVRMNQLVANRELTPAVAARIWKGVEDTPDVKNPAGLFYMNASNPDNVKAVAAVIHEEQQAEDAIDNAGSGIRSRQQARRSLNGPHLEAVERECVEAFANDERAKSAWIGIQRGDSKNISDAWDKAIMALRAHPCMAGLEVNGADVNRLDARAVAVLASRAVGVLPTAAPSVTRASPEAICNDGREAATVKIPESEIHTLASAAAEEWIGREAEVDMAMEEIRSITGDGEDFDIAVSILSNETLVKRCICARFELENLVIPRESQMRLAAEQLIENRERAVEAVNDLVSLEAV